MPAPVSPKLYFENQVGRLLEHPDGYAIFQYHPGKRNFTDLQALLSHTANLLKRKGWNRLMGDQRQMAPHTEEETAWIVNVWLADYTHRYNTIYGAILLAHDVFARLSMSQVMHDARESGLVYRAFDEEAKAADWLKQVA